jgi:SSS family solute:Na+ symporter
MEALQTGMIIGLIAVTFLIALTALISGWRVRSTDDFTVASRRAGWRVVSGIIVGALVGGSSTVGTAQAAFVYGLPAWWFTLGAGIGCVMLATLFAKPMRRSCVETLPQYLVCTFGNPIRPLVAVSDSIGIFLTIPGQAASAIALLAVLLHWSAAPVFILVSLLVIAYVFMGGAISAGVAGFVKMLICFATLLVFGTVALVFGGGFSAFHATLPARYFDLFGNGFWKDTGNGLGIVFGVLTTQVYVQAVLSGRDVRQSRIGTIVAGVGTTVFGLGGVAVGMFMRIHEPNIAPAQALPLFAAHYFSPVLSGIMLGAILITVITCAGGLALGIATMITRDLYQRYVRPGLSDCEVILVARTTIVVMVVLGVLIGGSSGLKLIISYSFLAFAFRADSMLIPVIVAAIGPRLRLNTAGAGIGAMASGMVTNIVWSLLVSPSGAAVFMGLAGSIIGLLLGHAVSLGIGGKRFAWPGLNEVFIETGNAPRGGFPGRLKKGDRSDVHSKSIR